MTQYIIELPHTEQTCPAVLNDMSASNPELFERICWGCMGDTHVGWGMVIATDVDEVRSMLPPGYKDGARIIEVDKFSPEDLQRMKQGTNA